MGLNDWTLTPPAVDDIEVSLVGPGKGIGECVMVHYGNNRWMVIDSCLDQETPRQPCSIRYFDKIYAGTTFAGPTHIIVTHWHDDHTRGISQVYKKYPTSILCMPQVFRVDEMFELIDMDSTAAGTASRRVLQELDTLLKLRFQFNGPAVTLTANLPLVDENLGGLLLQIHALSPSGNAVLKMQGQLAGYIQQLQADKAAVISSPEPNDCSAVIQVRIGNDMLLLGADLENHSDPNCGWQAVLNTMYGKQAKCQVFKIPHHGSQNGYNQLVWDNMIDKDNRHAILSPYKKGPEKLPTKESAQLILKQTKSSHITTNPHKAEVPDTGTGIKPPSSDFGMIRMRKKIAADTPWTVDRFGSAVLLESII